MEQGGEAAREESVLSQRRAWASELGLEQDEAEVFFRTLLRLSRRSEGTGV